MFCATDHYFTVFTQKILPQKAQAGGKHLHMDLHGTSSMQDHNSFHLVTSDKAIPNENPCSAAGPESLISNHR